jgi:hypothetical protein
MTMDALSLFGLFAVTAMLVAYAPEERSHWFFLAFSPALARLARSADFSRARGRSDWSKRSGPV